MNRVLLGQRTLTSALKKIETMTGSQARKSSTEIRFTSLIVRIALAAAFLSAVADRFGLWGPPGSQGVSWGNVANYESFVAALNWFAPQSLIPALGWGATIAEIVIAIGLICGWKLRWFALAAGLLLTVFASTMLSAFGPKLPLDYSVFSAAGAAFLLSSVAAAND